MLLNLKQTAKKLICSSCCVAALALPAAAQSLDGTNRFLNANQQAGQRLANAASLHQRSDFYEWSNNAWQHILHSGYVYDAQDKIDTITLKEVGSNANKSRNYYNYDSHGNLTENVEETWINNAWTILKCTRYNYTYSTTGKVTEKITQEWDNGNWRNAAREENLYSTNGLHQQAIQVWNNGTGWANSLRINYAYTNGQISSRTYQEFKNNFWQDSYRFYDYTWHVPNEKAAFYKRASFVNNVWLEEFRYTTTYQPNGITINLTEENVNGIWTNSTRVTNSDLTTQKSYILEEWQNGAWQKISELQTSYVYDASNNLTEYSVQRWDRSQNKLVNDYKEVFSNFKQVTAVPKELEAEALQVWPNPASNKLFISLPGAGVHQLTITDLTGRVVHTQQLPLQDSEAIQVDISNLKAGAYMLHTGNGTNSQVVRVLKQ